MLTRAEPSRDDTKRPRIGAANDPAERQADAVADALVGNAPPLALKCSACGDSGEPCPACSGSASVLRRSPLGGTPPSTSSFSPLAVAANGPSMPLPEGERRHFERRLGADLGGIRIHADSTAHRAARDVHARAFSRGQDLFFGQGEYQPHTASGRHLLAHEVAHTLQPDAGASLLRRAPGDGTEAAAPDMTGAAVTLENASVLSDVLASDAAYQPEEPWEALYNIFLNRGSAQFAGMLIRRLIARRWFEAEGIEPDSEPVEITRAAPPGPTVLPERPVCRVLGVDVPLSGGRITLLALDEAFGNQRLATLAGEVTTQVRQIGDAAGLQAQAAEYATAIPAFDTRVRARFAGARLNEITALLNQVTSARSMARTLADSSVASGYVGDLDTSLGTHADTLTTLSTDYQAWRTANPRDVTLSESAEQRTTEAMGTQQQMLDEGHYMAAAAWGESANANAMGLAMADLFGGRTQRNIAESYDRGELSFDEMTDLRHCAAVRSAVVGAVTVALMVATAGMGAAVVGGLGLAAEGTLAFSVMAGGIEAGTVTVASMGAEHFLTGARDFNNPYAQQIWRQGAYTPEQYLFGFGMGFGIGGAMGGGAHFLRGAGGAGSELVLAERGPLGLPAYETPGPWAPVRRPPVLTAGDSPLVLPRSEPGKAPFDVLDVLDDAATGTRTVRIRLENGELVTMVGHSESGMGYILRGNGEMLSVVNGEVTGPTRGLLGPAAEGAAAPTPMVFEGPSGPIRLPASEPMLQLPEYAASAPRGPAAMELWGDTRWGSYGGNWIMRDSATGRKRIVYQLDEQMVAERQGATPAESQTRYTLATPETFSGRDIAQSEVIPDVSQTGRLGPMPLEGPQLTEVKHRNYLLPGLENMQAMDTAGSLQRMYRAAGIEATINPAVANSTLQVVTSQSLTAETHNLIIREFTRWLLRQGIPNTEVMNILGRIRFSTVRPYQIRGGTVIREP
jgi:hypothetical protein